MLRHNASVYDSEAGFISSDLAVALHGLISFTRARRYHHSASIIRKQRYALVGFMTARSLAVQFYCTRSLTTTISPINTAQSAHDGSR